ncbi:MAG: hypothetical protein AB8G05_23740 [Oligoflexales bacterium]
MISKQALNCLIAVSLLFSGIISEAMVKSEINLLLDAQLDQEIISYYTNNPEYFDFELQKYRMDTKEKIGTGLKTSLPIGIGIAVFTLMGNPIAVVPITMGVVTGTMAIKKHFINKNMKNLLKGAYIYLEPDYIFKKRKAKKYLASFNKFYRKMKPILHKFDKNKLALKLLYINHFSCLIAKRLRNDPELATLQGFYKKNKVPKNGAWNEKFMLKYFSLLNRTLVDISKDIDFHQLNKIKRGLITTL